MDILKELVLLLGLPGPALQGNHNIWLLNLFLEVSDRCLKNTMGLGNGHTAFARVLRVPVSDNARFHAHVELSGLHLGDLS